MKCVAFFRSLSLLVAVTTSATRADIFQWEYINPVDPSQGKQQSTTLVPDGAGVDAAPGAHLSDLDLSMAYLADAHLSQAILSSANLYSADLTGATFNQANLTNAILDYATLTNADLTGAEVRGADFYQTGITLTQLYATASYEARDLSGISLAGNNLVGGNFVGQNLTNANFSAATLTDADFTGAEVRGAILPGVTLAQLYSTASYQAHDLTGIRLDSADLSGGNFTGQNLTNTVLGNLTGADVTGAEVRGANFYRTGITLAQLYSTASYLAHDLRGIKLTFHNLSGANFAGQNLRDADFAGADVTDVDFTGADLEETRFEKLTIEIPLGGSSYKVYVGSGIAPAQLYSTASYLAGDLSGINFAYNNLVSANFGGKRITDADFDHSDLTSADFRDAKLTNVNFRGARLTGAIFTGANMTGAEVRGAVLDSLIGFTPAQLYSTATYQSRDLTGTYLGGNDLSGWSFAGQNLQAASFYGSTLAGADLTGAYVHGYFTFDYRDAASGASFDATTAHGFTAAQLYSTASYRAHDLSAISLNYNDLSGWNFADQNLSAATFYGANLRQTNLTGALFRAAVIFEADVTGADVRGADFSRAWDWISSRYRGGITRSQLESTASYQSHDLTGIGLSSSNLTGWSFRSQNLTKARFRATTLTDTDFTGAEIQSADFDRLDLFNNFRYPAGTGITLRQLYSTASYQSKDLSGIGLNYNDLAGGNFAFQILRNAHFNAATLTGADFREADLTNATFYSANLTNADFTGAEIRGAVFFFDGNPGPGGTGITLAQLYSTANFQRRDIRGVAEIGSSIPATTNLILPDGHIEGLDLHAGDLLTIRDFNRNYAPIPVSVEENFAMAPGGTLRTVFDADAWDSTISFTPGIPVALGGTLELTFAADINLASQVGRTFDLFDWTGVNPTGAFTVSSPYHWDVSNLYTIGEVTLTAVPEPSSLFLFALSSIAILQLRRQRSLVLPIGLSIVPLVAFVSATRADIYQWEYINPADPSQGKRQSTTLAPDGAGVDAAPGANLSVRDLTMAYLTGADLQYAFAFTSNLTTADLSQANLANADFTSANLTNANFLEANLTNAQFGGADLKATNFRKANLAHADFTGLYSCADVCYPLPSPIPTTVADADFTDAEVRGVNLGYTGITLAQLYSTASYRAKDLSGIGLSNGNFVGGNFAGQNLTYASFDYAALTDADFTGAEVLGGDFRESGVTFAQLYSTASYQARDLRRIWFGDNLAGGNFVGQNLTNAHFHGGTLTDADFTGANVRGTDFSKRQVCFFSCSPGVLFGTGITPAQLYTTASYQAHDLTGIDLTFNDLAGANFVNQTLSNASFNYAQLTNADFTGAALTNANFTGAEIRGASFAKTLIEYGPIHFRVGSGITLAQLYSTASYQTRTLSGVSFAYNDLAHAYFAHQNLTNANFYDAVLTDADFTGADVRGAGFSTYYYSYGAITFTQLYSTASYQAHDLTGIGLRFNDLASANFARQNLTNADLSYARLQDADFTDTEVRGTVFDFDSSLAFGRGIALAQLYSTASYRTRDLSGISLSGHNLTGGNFAGQNLTNARFLNATLTDADFTAADARGAFLPAMHAITTNLIWGDGHIDSLNLNAGGRLVVRDYDGESDSWRHEPPIPITIEQHLAMRPGGTLRLVFDADGWDSTISFTPGIPVALGGTLELTFAADINLASQVGRTFDLFDWTGVNPTGAFTVSSPYHWDVSNLYTIGEVTLTAVPEPSCLLLAATGAIALALSRRRRIL